VCQKRLLDWDAWWQTGFPRLAHCSVSSAVLQYAQSCYRLATRAFWNTLPVCHDLIYASTLQ
jgi:hypothetical protein